MLFKWIFLSQRSLTSLSFVRRINHRSDFALVHQMKLLNQNQNYRELLSIFDHFIKEKSINQLPKGAITQVLKACGKLQDFSRAADIHRCLPSEIINDPYILPTLIHVYMQRGDLSTAENLYNQAPEKSLPIYGAMMKGYIKNKQPNKAIDLFKHIHVPNDIILLILFNACAQVPSDEVLRLVKDVSSKMPLSYRNNPSLITTLINVLMKCQDVSSAVFLFETIKQPTLFMYAAMMKGYIQNSRPKEAIEIFDRINNPDEVLLLLFFNACADMKSPEVLPIIRTVFSRLSSSNRENPSLMTSVIDALMKSGDVSFAESLFDQIKDKKLSLYGAMMKGYVENKYPNKAIGLFEHIRIPNEIILIIFFNACAQIGSDELLQKIKHISSSMPSSFHSNSSLTTSLIDALIKCGDISAAEQIFNRMTSKTLSMYGAMMKGYVVNDQSNRAIDLFRQIKNPSEIMLNLFFNACAQIQNEEALRLVKSVSLTLSKSSLSNNRLMTSLMDAFIKCGDCQQAQQIFDKIERNSISYGNLMNGYNDQQQPEQTVKLFQQMKEDGIEPDLTISLLVIKALSRISIVRLCEEIVEQIPQLLLKESMMKNALIAMWAKAGSIKRARKIFDETEQRDQYAYSSMIHGYGLQGMGSEALEIFHTMPSELINEVTYLSVLNACSHSGYVNQAKEIFDRINMKSDKIFTAMVDCLSRAAMFDQAEELIDEYEHDHAPIYAMYMALLSGARNYKNGPLAERIVLRMKKLFGDMKDVLISASILLANVYGSLGDIDRASDIRTELNRTGGKKPVGMSWTAPDGPVDKFRAHDRSHPRSKEIYDELDRISNELMNAGHRFDSSYVTRGLNDDETIESVLCGHSEKLAIAWNFVVNPKAKHIEITKNLRICPDCHQATKLLARIRQCEFTIRDANRRHHITTDGRCSCEEYF